MVWTKTMRLSGFVVLFLISYVSSDVYQCRSCQDTLKPVRYRRSIDLNAAHALISDTRLPREVTPNSYRLKLWPLPEEGSFDGTVWINITWQETTDKITLHVHKELQVAHSEVKVTLHTAEDSTKLTTPLPTPTPLKVLRTERLPKKPLYVIHLENELNRGSQCEIEIKFSGKLYNDTSEALFRSSYTDPTNGEKKWFVATHMRPNLARRVFPCFDEPAYKVPFNVIIGRNKNMTTLSNMPLKHSEEMSENPEWVWDHFLQTPPMSTFTLGILISDFHKLGSNITEEDASNPDKINVGVYARPDFIEALKDVPAKVDSVLNVLQDYWGVPYPLPKLDVVALPNFQAVKPADNWGLIFFKESDLSHRGIWHIAQEVVYQWLGDFATPFWWSDAHINKALTSYLAAVTSFKIDNGKDMQGKWPMTVLYSLYYEFSKRYPYARITGMKQETASVKTELIFRMLNHTLGEQTFRHGLQRFMADRQFKTFFGDDVWAALTEQTRFDKSLPENVTVNEIAASWITKDRLPVVNVTRNYEDNTALIRQRVYLRDRPHDVPDQDKLLWWIPIVMVGEDRMNFTNTTPVCWMRKEREITITDLPGSDHFIIVNPEEIGPFPVNYDVTNWNMLAQYLLKSEGRNNIPVNTRAKLLHDAWNLAYAGDLSFSTALNMTLFLKYERNQIAWDPVFTMIDHIGRHIDSSAVHKKFEIYVRKLLTPLYEELGDEPKEGEDSGLAHLRSLSKVFLCRAGYKPCIEEAQAAYKKWVSSENPDEGNPVPNQYICPVFKWGTREEWEFGLQRVISFPASRKQSERTYLLKTLAGCPLESWKIERLLNITILEGNGNFTDNDIHLIFTMLTGGASGYTTLFNFLKDNWECIKTKFAEKPHLWDSMITSATTVFTTQEGLDMVSELYVEHQGEFRTAEHIVEKALKNIHEETKWSDDNLPVIEKWLDEYLKSEEQESADAKFIDNGHK